MTVTWRPLAWAVVLAGTMGVGGAAAQTVIVKGAPAGSTVEFVLKAATVGSVAAGADGVASLSATGASGLGASEMDGYVFVDTCPDRRVVLVIERFSTPPPAAAACGRHAIPGVYWVRGVTTFVIDVAGASPVLRLRQGPAPALWLQSESDLAASVPTERRPSPTGLVLGGGAGLSSFTNAATLACGTGAECSDNGMSLAWAGNGAFWIKRYLAVEVGYLKPGQMKATGGGTGYTFSSVLDTDVVTMAAKAAAPIGPVRIYAFGGATYQNGTFTTTETIDAETVTVDSVSVTYPGGTQTLEQKTEGWGWLAGAGIEAWVTPMFAIYADGGYAAIKGSASDGTKNAMNDNLTYFVLGGRIRLGPKGSKTAGVK